jgi:hypothetical protein
MITGTVNIAYEIQATTDLPATNGCRVSYRDGGHLDLGTIGLGFRSVLPPGQ